MNSFALKKESTNDLGALASHHPSCSVEPMVGQPRGYRLELSGFLAPGWTGRLTAGLAQHRVGIVRGEAEKINASSWRSSFELKAAPFAGNPADIDYLRLAATEPAHQHDAARIALTSLVVEPPSRHQGSLYIEIKGVDRLGFLGDLLDYFSMRCLFPVKMRIETVEDQAVDRFWLRGVGGSVPSEAISASIRENLEQLLVPAR